jgi:hypothetical protein
LHMSRYPVFRYFFFIKHILTRKCSRGQNCPMPFFESEARENYNYTEREIL